MSEWGELIIGVDDPALQAPFVAEIVRQMRAVDRYGIWEQAGDHEIIDPFVMTRERKRDMPVVGDPDEEVISRLAAWYNALSAVIEQRTGRMAVPFIHIHHEGFGRALISVGRLIVLDRTLRDVHRFGFKSLQDLQDEAEKIIGKAVDLIETHQAVADL